MREFRDPFAAVSKIFKAKGVGSPRLHGLLSAVSASNRGDQEGVEEAVRGLKDDQGNPLVKNASEKKKSRGTSTQRSTLLTAGSSAGASTQRRTLLGST